MLTFAKFGAVGLLLALPRFGCESKEGTDRPNPSLPAPSSSVITIAAGIGFCESLEVCETECNKGSADRCRRLGVNYEFGHGVDVDGAHATALYEKACSMGSTDGCLYAGRMHEFHHGVAKDEAKAVTFYTRACDLSDAAGCANLAIMLESGRGVEKDLAKATQLFLRACAQGSSLACSHAKTLSGANTAGEGAGR